MQLNIQMRPIVGVVASTFKAFQKYTLAGDEFTGKDVNAFLRELGVPEAAAERAVLLGFANSAASTASNEPQSESPGYTEITGVLSSNIRACNLLRQLLDERVTSLSNKRMRYLNKRSEAVAKNIIPLLKGDCVVKKIVHTLAGLGIFGTAGWLIWTAKEQAWKTGTWAVLVIGTFRLLGNLLYNNAAVVDQVWHMVFVHVGLGVVAYALEILERAGIEFGTGTIATIGTVLANLIPLVGFYFTDIRVKWEDFFAKREQGCSGRASDEDAQLLRPVIMALEDYTEKSASLLDKASASKPGNRTGEVAQTGQAETQRLIDALKWDVEREEAWQGWCALFRFLLRQAAIKSPSLLYVLFTGIFLFVAALGDAKAVSDISVLILILAIETAKGIGNEHVSQDQMQYRVVKLTLSRFASIFFFAAPKINFRRVTGRTDFFELQPELAAVMAHLNAAFICVCGLYVIPAFELLVKIFIRAVGVLRSWR